MNINDVKVSFAITTHKETEASEKYTVEVVKKLMEIVREINKGETK